MGPKNVTQPINEIYRKYLNKSILASFHFTLIDENHAAKVLSSLQTKNSSGHDGVSMQLLKLLSPALLKPLTIVINQLLLTGIFPDKHRIAKVVPLHKKDDPSLTDNYRPIFLLPSISKLFEKIVIIQFTEYRKQNKLLFEGQCGFRENHSTELATIELMDMVISALDEKLTLTIYMGLSKAFDTLDHNILLAKLRNYGINGTPIRWFESNLTNRLHYVELNDLASKKQKITTGVPQGSILGPLLYLINMNDIINVSQAFKFILYADDATLFTTIEYSIRTRMSNIDESLNNELSHVFKWLVINRLSLSTSKNKFMVFHPYQEDITGIIPNRFINGIEIERVISFNFLGITLDENITWKPHIAATANKMFKYAGIFNKLKNYLPAYILRLLYCS